MVMQTKKRRSFLAIAFECVVADGIGMYRDLGFPSREDCAALPKDWPDAMYRGSLNAHITAYPANLDLLGKGAGIQRLDNRIFAPSGIVPGHLIENNFLIPNERDPDRGDAQIWPCTVEHQNTSVIFNAWAVRRSGSAYRDVIELMSHHKLRDVFRLKNDDAITVTLFAQKPRLRLTAG